MLCSGVPSEEMERWPAGGQMAELRPELRPLTPKLASTPTPKCLVSVPFPWA